MRQLRLLLKFRRWGFMKIVKDNRLCEFKRIENLLYGMNYEVWFNLYGPLDTTLELQEALRINVSKNAVVSGVLSSSPDEAKKEIMGRVLYEGDFGSGPIDIDEKRSEIEAIMRKIFNLIEIDDAEIISDFGFREGHPAYPVFWDFAYDIHSNGKRWIFIGSSSD
jgi:hypothetical protein